MIHFLLIIIYLSFISLGLPDSLLGAAWPSMHAEIGVPVSGMGVITMIIAAGTILSSLFSDRLTRWLGTGKITALSVLTTALALFGFSISHTFWQLCLWAIPYGLGAGSVDASLNNYVAMHFASRHMSWLHCMWGVGASAGPYIMGAALTGGHSWNAGYRIIGLIQIMLTAVLLFSLPLWQKPKAAAHIGKKEKPLSLRQIAKLPGAKEGLITFFCYCALEQTAGVWASTYLALYKGIAAETAAFLGGMFFMGITIGRALNGFLTFHYSDSQLVRIGQVIIGCGIAAMLLPLGKTLSIIGLLLVGLGCAPIYPCLLHATPDHFGPEKSQAIFGVQMASAYTGICLMPPLFGLIADSISLSLLPVYLLAILLLMVRMHENLLKICR